MYDKIGSSITKVQQRNAQVIYYKIVLMGIQTIESISQNVGLGDSNIHDILITVKYRYCNIFQLVYSPGYKDPIFGIPTTVSSNFLSSIQFTYFAPWATFHNAHPCWNLRELQGIYPLQISESTTEPLANQKIICRNFSESDTFSPQNANSDTFSPQNINSDSFSP